MAIYDSRTSVLILRILQIILALIVLGLIGYASNWWTGHWHATSPSQFNFLIFTSAWTLLALVYLIVVPWRFSDTPAHHKFAILGMETLTMLFWFAGFIATAVFLSDRPCWGSVCEAARAGTVFAAFEWVVFACSFALSVMHVVRTSGRTSDRGKADPNLNVAEGV
ncbi:hypothetical protein BAUCODRAFT_470051 [Baudoinia panamericana UAMH 10762]|uniref:MARVEL domain-containing protein n=1 Tax=Baudoinia panamericana (strain UAMH 10762) TaxID=717646 RepID=M2MXK5_BAUPA|nr:uncharacterized protein BAUCODRAFT_470051 [Baudoinia panamericana UAMH 10762]EMC96298.1 hypothetical protein BAUCODRAFT_470051 [Baudoinia panamericana UAMH 10762]